MAIKVWGADTLKSWGSRVVFPVLLSLMLLRKCCCLNVAKCLYLPTLCAQSAIGHWCLPSEAWAIHLKALGIASTKALWHLYFAVPH